MSGWQPGNGPRRAAERPPVIPPQFQYLPSQREYPPRAYEVAPPAAQQHRPPEPAKPAEPPRPAEPQRPPEPPRRGGSQRGLTALAWGSAVVLGVAALAIARTDHPRGASAAATASAHAVPKVSASRRAAVPPVPSPSCTLTATFDYIERTVLPGTSASADEIGNVDYADCTSPLSDFAATAGQADGECTTIAPAGDNPGYNVGENPAAPLRGVIESAGPGCQTAVARPRPRRIAALRGGHSSRPSPTGGRATPTPAPTPTHRLRPTTAPFRTCAPILCPGGQPIFW